MKNLASVIVIGGLALTGCATTSPLLSVPAVSMTNPSFPPDYKPTNLGPVNSKYCYGEEASTKHGDTVGLMDEVTMKAQHEKNATYISDAHYSYEGASCITLEGTAMK